MAVRSTRFLRSRGSCHRWRCTILSDRPGGSGFEDTPPEYLDVMTGSGVIRGFNFSSLAEDGES